MSKINQDTVKAVIYMDGAIDLNQDELKEKFKQAIEDNTINHFEIKTGRKNANQNKTK
jgi:hypothetical protein